MSVGRRMAPLTLETVGDLPAVCQRCVAWELDPVAAVRARENGDTAFEKEAWLSSVMLSWGTAGRLAYVDDQLAGFLLYAPPAHVPRSVAFPTSPISADAVLLMSGRVLPRHRGGGIARMLVQGVAKDLTQRGVRAVEAFGAARRPVDEPRVPVISAMPDAVDAAAGAGAAAGPGASQLGGGPGGAAGGPQDVSGDADASGDVLPDDDASPECLIPAPFLEAVGFTVVRPHRHYPRLRLELRTALSWREDVEAALERILSTVRVPSLSGV